MREKIIALVFCIVIFGIVNQSISSFTKKDKVSDVVKGHELEQNKKKDTGIKGLINSYTSNLTGKKEGAKMAGEVTKKTSQNTYIESTQVLLGKTIGYFIKQMMMGILLRIIRVPIIMMKVL